MRPPLLSIFMLTLFLGGLVRLPSGCRQADPATLEDRQRQNNQLVKQLQRCLNQQDMRGLAQLFADQVRCKDPTTGYEERMLPRQQVLRFYQPPDAVPPFLEIIQLYAASQHQVVAEGRLRGKGAVCLIYTIEQGQITRQYTY